ncbi:polysaccharide biosynthesis protein [Ferruginivarius sediminum]|uniref:polysaccharide biosynthesis protein n=1 Tax=Ferruginivarius sediminum TaxID=2661937 RepID=UPI001F4D69E5|nr:nucleoside-diphosphate sugar epimerase/dehydratase [Ferruginivarius sediminum]
MPLPRNVSVRAVIAFVHDVIMAAVSFFLALGLRLGDDVWSDIGDPDMLRAWVAFTAVCAVVFWFTGLYRGIWRYASLQDLVSIAKAVTLSLLIFLPVTFLITRLDAVPRSFLVIDWFVLIFLLGASRMIYRVFKDRGFDHLLERQTGYRVPVLLVGAGDAAEMFIRDLRRDREATYEPVGILDEKGTRVGRQIRGVPVMDGLDGLPTVVESLRRRGRSPQRLIVTRPLGREQMARLLDLADEYGMTLARLPRLTEFKSGSGSGETGGEQKPELRPIAIEDLLGRPQASLDREAMARLIAGRRVLVTGAGGSIGSELVRQAADFGPDRLILVDHAEHLLYNIDLELSERCPDLPRRPVLADVRDRSSLERLFADEAPELVLHAAALKHVPLAESNPGEAVLTNVMGTCNVAELSRAHGARAMIQVSTDKAIDPTSVMGATKRLAESYCQALDLAERGGDGDGQATRFVTVRFGNVLGSTGSVVPLFQRQLGRGGPITVTHPEMTRYFMTVREAVQLVLQASALGTAGGESAEIGKIYVLDMGEPIRIVDLARQMIRLAGLRPDKDVEIVFTGMRPGEKLHEKLFHTNEPMVATSHPSLKLAEARTANLALLRRGIDGLAAVARDGEDRELKRLLGKLVPDWVPTAGSGSSEAEAVPIRPN